MAWPGTRKEKCSRVVHLDFAPHACMPRCRPKPETLKRKEEEAAALRNSRKGLRGAARVAAGRPGTPVKGGSKTVYGPPKPRCVIVCSFCLLDCLHGLHTCGIIAA